MNIKRQIFYYPQMRENSIISVTRQNYLIVVNKIITIFINPIK